MPTKYKSIPEELQKIDYGTAKSHYANVRFKQGLPKIAGGDIKKGTPAYNDIVLLQKSLKEKDFILLLAELADRSPEHWQMMAKYYEKRGFDIKVAGQVLADAKTFYGEAKGPLDSISNLAIAGSGGGPIQEAPKPLPPPLAEAPKVNKGYPAGFLNMLPRIDPFIEKPISFKQAQAEQKARDDEEEARIRKNREEYDAKYKIGQALVDDMEKRLEVEDALREFYLPDDEKAEEDALRAPSKFSRQQVVRTVEHYEEQKEFAKKIEAIRARVAQRLYWSCLYKEGGNQKILDQTKIILEAYYGPIKELYPVVNNKLVGLQIYKKDPSVFYNMFTKKELDGLETYFMRFS
jgi:hypothetical protein